MSHLTEEQLNLYLDNELSTVERDAVEAHLANCNECRAEVAALQRLFTALEELAHEPAPDLVPGVLAHIRSHRKFAGQEAPRFRPLWLIPTLQAIAALLLFAWGRTRLSGYWAAIVDALTRGRLGQLWAWVSAWAVGEWAMLRAWPSTAWAEFQGWIAWLPTLGDLRFSPTQLAVLGTALVSLWLVGNAVLLHYALLNGQGKRQLG